MSRSILVVGSTGNTGQHVMRTLSALLSDSTHCNDYDIIGLTRSLDSSTARALSQLPESRMLEVDWKRIDANWLREHRVERAFFAGPVGPTAFNDESLLLTSMLEAGLKYVVRVSTAAMSIVPDSKLPHGRMHWAIENLLGQPEFARLQWTSLQPNIFTGMALSSAVDWVKKYHETGLQTPFRFSLAADAGVAMINPADVGVAAAHLLVQADPSAYTGGKYQLSGPENVTGQQVVKMVERAAGVSVEEVCFEDLSFLDQLVKEGYTAATVEAIKHGFTPLWDGACSREGYPTSRAIRELADPVKTADAAFREMQTG